MNNTNRNLWPYALIATFVIFISGTVGLVIMACSQKVDLVSENYYDQEIKYQSRIDSAARAQNLGAKVEYDSVANQIVVSLPAAQIGKNLSGQIQLYRPAAAGLDREFKLQPDAKGIQTLDAANLQNGLWKVRVAWNADGEDFFMEREIVMRSAAAPTAVGRALAPNSRAARESNAALITSQMPTLRTRSAAPETGALPE